MHLQNIQLINFKNFAQTTVECHPEVNCLVGKNGSGKTNFLDAIHYLSFTKSAFNAIDNQNIRHNEPFFSILAQVLQQDKKIKLQCSLKTGQKKEFKWNNEEYEKLSDHIGRLPVVLITPYDTDLIRDGSEARRKYFDMVLSQCDHQYLQQLIRYNHFLKQRNAVLKNMAQSKRWRTDLLDPYDHELLPMAKSLHLRRYEFTKEYVADFHPFYAEISQKHEATGVSYQSSVGEGDFEQRFIANREEDIIKQRTCLGIHRDDYSFTIDDYPIKKFGSQGQQKSLVISLKLAQFKIIHRYLELKPILLLDDVFDKLDDERIAILTRIVTGPDFGQLFITDARPERTRTIFQDHKQVAFSRVEQGEIYSEK